MTRLVIFNVIFFLYDNKLLQLIESLTEAELNTPFDFSQDEKKKRGTLEARQESA